VPYNNLTSRSDVEALVPEEVSRAMLGKEAQTSAVLNLFGRVPVARNAVRFPILSALPTAYWVTGDTGLKQTTEMAWSNKYMTIEELATIMPVPENVLEDMDMDLWTTAEPYLREAFNTALDTAVFFGVNAPASFPQNVLAATIAAGNAVTQGTAPVAGGGIFGDIDEMIGRVEDDGYDINGWVAARSLRRFLRSARNANAERPDAARLGGDLGTLDGETITYPMRGLWTTGGSVGTNVRAFAGDFGGQFKVGVRQDITLKVLTESVIQDNTGAIIYNLAQQDMVALRVKFRVGWQVANTINNDNPNASTRYPASALVF
jgi:hypothetical protein